MGCGGRRSPRRESVRPVQAAPFRSTYHCPRPPPVVFSTLGESMRAAQQLVPPQQATGGRCCRSAPHSRRSQRR
eukprot:2239854-Prymnesium_polylepis.1